MSDLVRLRLWEQDVAGSNPVSPTTTLFRHSLRSAEPIWRVSADALKLSVEHQRDPASELILPPSLEVVKVPAALAERPMRVLIDIK